MLSLCFFTTMAQPLNEPLRDDLQSETVLRSGRTFQRPAASATVATASDLSIAGTTASALSAGIIAAPVGDSTGLASQTASLPRDAVHAPLDFTSGTATEATSVSSPEDRLNLSPVTASDLSAVMQAISTLSKRFEDATVSFTAACACIALPSPSFDKIPEFSGVEQDPTAWLQLINSLACQYAWPDDIKISLVERRLRGSAKALHYTNVMLQTLSGRGRNHHSVDLEKLPCQWAWSTFQSGRQRGLKFFQLFLFSNTSLPT